jgi:hypothetical protein
VSKLHVGDWISVSVVRYWWKRHSLLLLLFLLWARYIHCGPGSSVGIVTGYGLYGPGIESWLGWNFSHPSRPALGPTQPPVQWVPGLSWGVKGGRGVTLTPYPLLVPWSRKGRAIPLLPLWAVRPVLASVPVQGCNFRYMHYILWACCNCLLMSMNIVASLPQTFQCACTAFILCVFCRKLIFCADILHVL